MNNPTLYTKLEEFKQATFGWHKTHAAKDKLLELKALLTPEEASELSAAHADMRAGNGSIAFFAAMDKFILKYRLGGHGPAGETALL